MKKSDYEDLCKSVLRSGGITIEDYFDMKFDKEYYERKYNEIFSESFRSDSLLMWISILCSFLLISIIINFVLYFS